MKRRSVMAGRETGDSWHTAFAAGETTEHEHQGALALLVALLEIVVIGVFVATFVIEPARVPSASMSPELRVGDLVLLDRQSYAPAGWWDRKIMPPSVVRRGAVAVFLLADGRLGVDERHTLLVKRIVGMPGDSLQMRDDKVVVNGVPLSEPYTVFSPGMPSAFRDEFPSLAAIDPGVEPAWWAFLRGHAPPGRGVTVPAGEYFVMGDNRNESLDSRYWGFVPAQSLLGRPIAVYWRR